MQCQELQSVAAHNGRRSARPGLCLLVLVVLLCMSAPLWVSAADGADNRLALVIGNATYAESPLKNPLNDAADMAGVLEDLGFDVILRTDANRREMGKAIREFGRRLKKSRGVGLFYYAGHGMQLENRNYLIPVDTPMYDEDEVPYESIDVGSVLAKMQSAGNALNLLILDACRNNPFPTQFRSSNRGLARVEAPVGSLVVYATAPGKVASDGSGRNGIFTGHLLHYLQESGLSLTQTIRRTRAAVVQETAGRQVPWESSSLLKEYYLKPAEPEKPDTQAIDQKVQANLDALFWQSAQAGNTVAEYQAYLKRFPDGMFTELAAARLDQLQSVSIATTGDDKPLIVAAVNPENTSTAENKEAPPLRTKALNLTDTTDRTRPEKKNPEIAATVDEPVPAVATLVETLEPDPEIKAEEPPEIYTLTVVAKPDDARIRIMNIVEKYRPDIVLAPDKEYDVYVTKPGYRSWREKIRLTDTNYILNVELEELAPVFPNLKPVAGGSFNMGCSSGDNQCARYEKPTHSVALASFSISATEVTVGQFRSFVDQTGYRTDAERNHGGFSGCYTWSETTGIGRSNSKWSWKRSHQWQKPGYWQNDSYPVTCVSWNDATAYTQWLSQITGKNYRLPTESQWEFAARAGSTKRYSHGNNSSGLCRYANVADTTTSPKGSKWSNKVSCSDRHWFPAAVGSYRANTLGLYDMQGNVWEWVQDGWSANYEQAASDGRAYGSEKSAERVLRGGAWDSNASLVRVSGRSKSDRNRRAAMIGFRVVAD